MDPNTSAGLRRFGQLFARVLLCAVFLVSGSGKIADWQGTTEFMAAKGMPAVSLLPGLRDSSGARRWTVASARLSHTRRCGGAHPLLNPGDPDLP